MILINQSLIQKFLKNDSNHKCIYNPMKHHKSMDKTEKLVLQIVVLAFKKVYSIYKLQFHTNRGFAQHIRR